MGIKAGLVGLPNVGKSTLFNALTKSSVPAENYPFCTIDPHIAITQVPDERLDNLAALYQSKKIIPATVTFVDIAGLVKGAAAGQGLGNQFLGHIREVDLIIHVLRCFDDPNVIHTSQHVDPLADYQTVVAELMLKDLESLDKHVPKLEKKIKSESNAAELKKLKYEHELLKKIRAALDDGDDARVKDIVEKSGDAESRTLLCAKKILVVANISESAIETYESNVHYKSLVDFFGPETVVPLCVRAEYELAQLPTDQMREMMDLLGIATSGLDTIIKKTYAKLGLITFFTCGPKEAHAWPIIKGTTIRAAAGEIHSDLERGFICAEIFNASDIFELGDEQKVKAQGRIRSEGQDYIVCDGDIALVRFNV